MSPEGSCRLLFSVLETTFRLMGYTSVVSNSYFNSTLASVFKVSHLQVLCKDIFIGADYAFSNSDSNSGYF